MIRPTKREQYLRLRKIMNDQLRAEVAADRQPENKRKRKLEKSAEFRAGRS